MPSQLLAVIACLPAVALDWAVLQALQLAALLATVPFRLQANPKGNHIYFHQNKLDVPHAVMQVLLHGVLHTLRVHNLLHRVDRRPQGCLCVYASLSRAAIRRACIPAIRMAPEPQSKMYVLAELYQHIDAVQASRLLLQLPPCTLQLFIQYLHLHVK